MPTLKSRLLETVICGILLLVITAPIAKYLYAQGASLMMGRTSGGLNKIFLTDSSGQLGVSGVSVTVTSVSISGVDGASGQFPVNISGVSPASGAVPIVLSGVTIIPITETFSNVVLNTSTTVQLLPADTTRRGLCFANVSASYSGIVTTTSPVVSTTPGYLLQPIGTVGINGYCESVNASTDAWFGMAFGGGSVSMVVGVKR